MGKKADLLDFEHGMVVGARRAGLCISQSAQAHQNWTKEDCKNIAWSDESRFLLQHSDGRVRI